MLEEEVLISVQHEVKNQNLFSADLKNKLLHDHKI